MSILNSSVILLTVSVIGSLLLVKRNRALDQRVTKIMMFGLYFWVLTFAQAILYVLVYVTMIK
ncbi:MAG: hypothetical protein ACU843_09575 [Gammaproteobacteria bacterium]